MPTFISNAPHNYTCPICLALNGVENGDTLMHQADIFYKDDFVTGFINSFSLGGITGNALIVPNKHFENLYELPITYGHRIFDALQKTATAMKQAYRCNGVTMLQCNEPAGGQHAFHYHHHAMQRYADDDFMSNLSDKAIAPPTEKAQYAAKLRAAFAVLHV